MKSILKKLNIDETLTKPAPKEKHFSHVKDMIKEGDNLNFMCDLLHLPETKNGYEFLFVCVDLSSNKFDIEPMKTRDAKSALQAYKKCIEREYIKDPKFTIQSDNGKEFMGEFHQYFKDKSILHNMIRPYRHKQNSVVEALNKALGRIFNGYMNMKEEETEEVYKEWDEIIDFVRKELNEYRSSKEFKKNQPKSEPIEFIGYKVKSKYKIGDIVFVKNEVPKNALNNDQSTKQFRVGDYRYSSTPRKIIDIFIYPKPVNFRYKVTGINDCSFVASELLKSKEKQEKYDVKKITEKKIIKGRVHYKVLWKGYTAKDATFEPRTNLIEDGFKKMIDEFENTLKAKKPKK